MTNLVTIYNNIHVLARDSRAEQSVRGGSQGQAKQGQRRASAAVLRAASERATEPLTVPKECPAC